jgi:transmembrane sensor
MLSRIENDPVLGAAAEWFFEVRSADVSVERIAEWQQWLAADPANRQSFERIESFWRLSEDVETPAWPTDSEVAADRYNGAESVLAWREKTKRSAFSRWPLLTSLAACVAVLAVLATWFVLRVPSVVVATQVGETRSLSLPDGSTVAIGGDSSIEARFAERSREVALEHGEAFFHVAKDAVRPFVVHAGGTSITAIGTAFNVRRTESGVTVAVAEGSVRVTSPDGESITVAAGLQARVEARPVRSADRTDLQPVNAASIAGWRDGRLQYMDEPLGTVIGDIARYSSRRIVIEDAQVRQLRITGIVFQHNVDGWLASLQATLPVQILKGEDGTVRIESRAADPTR